MNRSVHIDFYDVDQDGSEVSLDSPEPEGYIQWHYWAGLQSRHGRRQVRCSEGCGRLRWAHLDTCKGCRGDSARQAVLKSVRRKK